MDAEVGRSSSSSTTTSSAHQNEAGSAARFMVGPSCKSQDSKANAKRWIHCPLVRRRGYRLHTGSCVASAGWEWPLTFGGRHQEKPKSGPFARCGVVSSSDESSPGRQTFGCGRWSKLQKPKCLEALPNSRPAKLSTSTTRMGRW